MKKVHNCPLARLPCLRKWGRLATTFSRLFFPFLGPLLLVQIIKRKRPRDIYSGNDDQRQTCGERLRVKEKFAKVIYSKYVNTLNSVIYSVTCNIETVYVCVCRVFSKFYIRTLGMFRMILQRFGNIFISAEFDQITLLWK